MKKRSTKLKTFFLATFLMMNLLPVIYAQEQNSKIITGKVMSEKDGLPLPGVTVRVIGTNRGVVTDFDGDYTIKAASPTDVLTFTFVGFIEKEVQVGNQSTIDIRLEEDVSQLDEVVLVAYGTKKKAAFTGSAAFIDPEEIQKTASSNISSALQGLSPGIQVLANSGQPGSDAMIQIRGFSSLGGSNAPLIILNGSPYEAPLSSIAPNEIENISVLKDAASTSLYGSRAANGVILITTKSGIVGKTIVNFRTTLGTSDFAVALPNKLDAKDQFEAVWKGFYFDNLQRGLSDEASRANASGRVTDRFFIARPHMSFLGYERQYRSNWNIDDPVGLDGKIKPEAELLYEYDWHDVFEPKLRQEYAFDFSSGSEKTKIFVASSYLSDKGQYFNQDFQRWSTRVNVNTELSDRINFEASLFYLKTDQNNPGEFVRVIRTIPSPIHPYEFNHEEGGFFTDVFGNPALQKGGGQSYSGRRFFNSANPFDYSIAPKEPDSYAFDINSTNQVTNNLGLGVEILEGLNLRTRLVTDFSVFQRHEYVSPVEGIIEVDGYASKQSRSRFSYTANSILEYQKTYGDNSFSLMGGGELYSWNVNNLSGRKEVFAVPGLFELDAASAEPSTGSFENNYKLASVFSRLEYDYQDKIYLSMSYRADGSSRFSPDSRWGNFWSVGSAWRLSEENFLINSPYVNNLKLKASYGTTGNDQLSLYAYQALFDLSYNFYENSGAIEQRLPTPELGWEKNIQFNAGLEFRLFDRFFGNFEYFVKTSDDLLFSRPLPPSFGITSVDDNIAKVQNRGFEVDLGVDLIKKKDFNWTFSVNATHYKNEIIELPVEEVLFGNYRWIEGGSIHEYWTPSWAGVDPETGDNTWHVNILDDSGNVMRQEVSNNWNEVNQQVNHAFQGSSIPDVFGGINNTLRYKGLDFSFMFYYSLGGVMYDNAFNENINMRNAFGLIDYWRDNHWSPENRNTDIPRPSHSNWADNGRTTNQYMYNNDFVRLRTLNLGYTLPSSVANYLNITSLRIFVQGDNLFTWGPAADRGTDPELAGFNGSSAYNWGIRKTVTAGLHFQF